MKKYLLWFMLLCKRQLHHKILLVLLVCLPVCTFLFSRVPAMTDHALPRVGLILTDEDALASEAVASLLQDNTVVEFYIPESAQALNDAILTGDTECGYIFENQLTSRLTNGNASGCITLLHTPNSLVTSLTNEMVFSSVFRLLGKSIAQDYLASEPLLRTVLADAKLVCSERYEFYLNGPATFHVEFKMLSGTSDITADIQEQSTSFPLRGILAILIFIAGLFGVIQWRTDCEHGVFAAMSQTFRLVSRPMYAAIPVLLFAVSAYITLFAGNIARSWHRELISLMIYIVAVVLFATLLSYVIPSSRLLTATLPVFILGSLICCPVFIDLSGILPVIQVLEKCFLPYYYLIL